MCGRFACSEIPAILGETFAMEVPGDLPARTNIAPSMPVCALIRDEETRQPAFGWMQWGLLPFWAKDKTISARMFNARCETVHGKPSFRAALRHRRCLIPADCFYEWKKEGTKKQPYRIALARQPMVFAGLWEIWEGPLGEVILSCTILTTRANAAMKEIHDRMPVILPQDAWVLWMDHRVQPHREVSHLFEPVPSDELLIQPLGQTRL